MPDFRRTSRYFRSGLCRPIEVQFRPKIEKINAAVWLAIATKIRILIALIFFIISDDYWSTSSRLPVTNLNLVRKIRIYIGQGFAGPLCRWGAYWFVTLNESLWVLCLLLRKNVISLKTIYVPSSKGQRCNWGSVSVDRIETSLLSSRGIYRHRLYKGFHWNSNS